MPYVDVASFSNGLVFVQAEYNANNQKISGFEITNNSDYSLCVLITKSGVGTINKVYGPHTFTVESIPPGWGFEVVERTDEDGLTFYSIAGPNNISTQMQFPCSG